MGHASPDSTAGYAAWDVSCSVGMVRELRIPGRDSAPAERSGGAGPENPDLLASQP